MLTFLLPNASSRPISAVLFVEGMLSTAALMKMAKQRVSSVMTKNCQVSNPSVTSTSHSPVAGCLMRWPCDLYLLRVYPGCVDYLLHKWLDRSLQPQFLMGK
jgi:hypothetical protein